MFSSVCQLIGCDLSACSDQQLYCCGCDCSCANCFESCCTQNVDINGYNELCQNGWAEDQNNKWSQSAPLSKNIEERRVALKKMYTCSEQACADFTHLSCAPLRAVLYIATCIPFSLVTAALGISSNFGHKENVDIDRRNGENEAQEINSSADDEDTSFSSRRTREWVLEQSCSSRIEDFEGDEERGGFRRGSSGQKFNFIRANRKYYEYMNPCGCFHCFSDYKYKYLTIPSALRLSDE